MEIRLRTGLSYEEAMARVSALLPSIGQSVAKGLGDQLAQSLSTAGRQLPRPHRMDQYPGPVRTGEGPFGVINRGGPGIDTTALLTAFRAMDYVFAEKYVCMVSPAKGGVARSILNTGYHEPLSPATYLGYYAKFVRDRTDSEIVGVSSRARAEVVQKLKQALGG